MKWWIPMLLILFAVAGICIWDGIHTHQVFAHMESESNAIYKDLLSTEITDENMQKRIKDLNEFWTKEMDMLCISISRKDLQPISDYLQYLSASIINESQEDAITYSRLLNYNVIGLKQSNGFEMLNLL